MTFDEFEALAIKCLALATPADAPLSEAARVQILLRLLKRSQVLSSTELTVVDAREKIQQDAIRNATMGSPGTLLPGGRGVAFGPFGGGSGPNGDH